MSSARNKTLSLYFPLAIFFCLASAVGGISWFITHSHDATQQNEVELIGRQTAKQIENYVTNHLSIVENLRELWVRRQINTPEAFTETVESFRKQFSGFQSVNWVDAAGTIRWVVPEAENRAAKGADLTQHPIAAPLLRQAAEQRADLATAPLQLLQGGKGFVTYFPIFRNGTLEGYASGVFRINALMEGALAQSALDSFEIVIAKADHQLYSRGLDTRNSASWMSYEFKVLNRTWTLNLRPSRAMLSAQSVQSDKIVLVLGLLFSAGLAYLLRLVALRQNALWDAEESYRALFENATEGVYRSLPDGTCIRSNPALAKLNGFETQQEVIEAFNGRPGSWYVDPSRRDTFLRLLKQNGRVENFVSEVHRLATGETYWISENAHLVRDESGRVLGYQGTVLDITERRRSDEILRREREFVVAMLDTAGALIVVLDIDGRVVRFNKTAEKLSGYRLEEVEGKPVFEFVIPQEDHEGLRNMLRNLRLGVYPITNVNYWESRDGERRLIEWSNTALRDDQGRIAYCVAIGIDITERKQTEEALQFAKEAAESANRAKSEFLANMSHELRTPLNAVIGFAEILENQMFGDMGDSRYGDYARDIRGSATHLLGIINNILDLSKVEAGRLELNESANDVLDVVNSCMNIVRATPNGDQVHFSVKAPEDLPYLLADEKMLRQILINILSNAVKFTPDGGNVTVTLGLDDRNNFEIRIADTGIGMTAAGIVKAMKPFGQVDSSLSRKYEGTGLGLPLSQSLIELHRGILKLESTPDVGTTVIIGFPADRVIWRHEPAGQAQGGAA